MTDNNNLIDSLSEDLSPVKPLCFYKRTSTFILLAYIAIFAIVSFIGFREDVEMIVDNPSVLYQLVALFITGLLSTIVTFRLTRPSEKVGFINWGLIALSTGLLGAVLIFCAVMGDKSNLPPISDMVFVFERLKNVFLISLLPIILMVFMVRRGRPVHTSLVGFTSFLAVTALSITGCRLTCPIDSLYGNLLWHYLPIVVLSGIGYLIGRYLYRW